MPMVPTFQGGLPQVRDSGNSGFSPINVPQDRTDYDAVMKKALMPVQEWANSAVKAQTFSAPVSSRPKATTPSAR